MTKPDNEQPLSIIQSRVEQRSALSLIYLTDPVAFLQDGPQPRLVAAWLPASPHHWIPCDAIGLTRSAPFAPKAAKTAWAADVRLPLHVFREIDHPCYTWQGFLAQLQHLHLASTLAFSKELGRMIKMRLYSFCCTAPSFAFSILTPCTVPNHGSHYECSEEALGRCSY